MIVSLISAFIPLPTEPIHLYTATNVRQDAHVMVRGVISEVNGNAFTIGEHTLYINPTQTGSFRLLGTIETDARAEVRARRVGEILYAEHVVIVGTGQGRNQTVMTARSEPKKPPRDSVNADTRTTLWIKARGTFDQLALYLKNALNLFTSVSI